MDRFRTDRNRTQRCRNYNTLAEPEYDVAEPEYDVAEPEYDVVDDQEHVLNVRILPARPLNDDREYADRDLPRSSSAQSLSSLSTGNSNILPRTSAPVINRDLKPSRRKTRLDKRSTPVPPPDQRSLAQPLLLLLQFTVELKNNFSGLNLHEPFRRDGQISTRKAEFSPHVKGLQRTESVSASHNNLRHSLDLETHDLETRLQQNLERVPSKRHHHEWPQTKEDIDQHDFVPMEKPQQTYCEADWYVRACSRADAEHALHLVNKDGAFLVRDCSINTNSEPLVLAVYHEKKVYNVKIRYIQSTSKYALGTGQRSNDMFDSVADIIKFHSIFPIILISGRNISGSRYPDNCVLTCPVTKRDVDQLLQ